MHHTFPKDRALPYAGCPTPLEGLHQGVDLLLGGLSGLGTLDLSETQVGDAGLEHLGELSGLHWLSLDSTNVTDAGLMHLKGLSNLDQLNINDTLVTEAGYDALWQALPKSLPRGGYWWQRSPSPAPSEAEAGTIAEIRPLGGRIRRIDEKNLALTY